MSAWRSIVFWTVGPSGIEPGVPQDPGERADACVPLRWRDAAAKSQIARAGEPASGDGAGAEQAGGDPQGSKERGTEFPTGHRPGAGQVNGSGLAHPFETRSVAGCRRGHRRDRPCHVMNLRRRTSLIGEENDRLTPLETVDIPLCARIDGV